MKGLIWLAALILLVPSSPLNGKPQVRPPMPPGIDDPGPLPVDALSKIVRKLRMTLKGPYSLRDLTVCPPVKSDAHYSVGYGAWMPASLEVKITLNSKNSYGGYTGPTLFYVSFQKGEVTDLWEDSGIGYRQLDAKMLEAAQNCPRISDAEVQQMLRD
jgi:hypothetical protein